MLCFPPGSLVTFGRKYKEFNLIRRGFIDISGIDEMNSPAPDCRECDSLSEKRKKVSCGDGLGGHGWEEVTYYCQKLIGECPADIRDCPQKNKEKQ